jgi:1-acyl-sn-glycerol-3-phosphate acyltransferase
MWGKELHVPRLLPRKTLRLVVGPPVPLDDLRGQPTTPKILAEATDRIMDAITALVAELRQQPPPSQRHDPRRDPRRPTGGGPDRSSAVEAGQVDPAERERPTAREDPA